MATSCLGGTVDSPMHHRPPYQLGLRRVRLPAGRCRPNPRRSRPARHPPLHTICAAVLRGHAQPCADACRDGRRRFRQTSRKTCLRSLSDQTKGECSVGDGGSEGNFRKALNRRRASYLCKDISTRGLLSRRGNTCQSIVLAPDFAGRVPPTEDTILVQFELRSILAAPRAHRLHYRLNTYLSTQVSPRSYAYVSRGYQTEVQYKVPASCLRRQKITIFRDAQIPTKNNISFHYAGEEACARLRDRLRGQRRM